MDYWAVYDSLMLRAKMIETKRVREYDHSARMTQWWADRKADTQRIGG